MRNTTRALIGEELKQKEETNMDVYERAVKVFGEKAQLVMVMEEAAELIQACSKDYRGLESNINEEIADMEIMLEQMKHFSCYDQEAVDAFHNEKVSKLNDTLELIEEGLMTPGVSDDVSYITNIERIWSSSNHMCGSCGKIVGSDAKECPHCGAKFIGEMNDYSGHITKINKVY